MTVVGSRMRTRTEDTQTHTGDAQSSKNDLLRNSHTTNKGAGPKSKPMPLILMRKPFPWRKHGTSLGLYAILSITYKQIATALSKGDEIMDSTFMINTVVNTFSKLIQNETAKSSSILVELRRCRIFLTLSKKESTLTSVKLSRSDNSSPPINSSETLWVGLKI